MRGDPIVLVECDHCHECVELRLIRLDARTWTTESVNSALESRGWVTDPFDGNDYCGEECRKAATKGRRADATQIG